MAQTYTATRRKDPTNTDKTREQEYGHVTDIYAPYLADELGERFPNNEVTRNESGDVLKPWYPTPEECTTNEIYLTLVNVDEQEKAIAALGEVNESEATKAALAMTDYVHASAPLQQFLLDAEDVLKQDASARGTRVLDARNKVSALHANVDKAQADGQIHAVTAIKEELADKKQELASAEFAYKGVIALMATLRTMVDRYKISAATLSRAKNAKALLKKALSPTKKSGVEEVLDESETFLAQLAGATPPQAFVTKKAKPTANQDDAGLEV
jgi:hypothetical protein